MIDNEDFYICWDYERDTFLMHSGVHVRWTVSVRERFIDACKQLAKEHDYPIVFTQIPASDLKLNKFTKGLGFVLVSQSLQKHGLISIYRMDTKCYK